MLAQRIKHVRGAGETTGAFRELPEEVQSGIIKQQRWG